MKIDIESIKDAVYEFEGLLELADLREDKLAALLPLMKNKLDVINSLFNDIESDEENDNESDEDSEIELNEENDIEEEEFEEKPLFDESDVEYHKDVIEEEVEEAESELYQIDRMEDNENESLTTTIVNDEDYVDDSESNWNVIPVIKDEDDEEEVTVKVKNVAVSKPAFCINDRFRFRRELFNNSDADFNAAMDLVTTMDDYEEAEDYFIGALGWDMEKPEVADFMAIIQNYFDK